MIAFIVGFVIGALATLFVIHNNLKRATAAWTRADALLTEAKLLKSKV